MIIECESFNEVVGERLVAKVRSLEMFVPDWCQEFLIRSYGDTRGMGISTERKYCRMILYIGNDAFTFSDAKFDRFIYHEIAHGYNSGITMCVDEHLKHVVNADIFEFVSSVVNERIEEQTEDLTLMILRVQKLLNPGSTGEAMTREEYRKRVEEHGK